MKRILITVNHFMPKRGGLEAYNLNLAIFLSKKYEVHVVTNNTHNVKEEEMYKNFKIHRLPCKDILPDVLAFPTLEGIKRLWGLRKLKFDVLISNTRFFPLSWLTALFSVLWKKPLIHIEHGNSYVQHPSKKIALISLFVDKILGRFVVKTAHQTIGISNACEKFAQDLGAKNTAMVPNSIVFKDFKQKRHSIFKSPIFICIGRLIHAKGFQDLIRALHVYNGLLYVVGNGPYKQDIMELAREKKINAIFFDHLSPHEYKQLFKHATMLINPSYAEGLPTSILEAGAMNIPIIATNVGGTEQIINHGKNGYLIDINSVSQIRLHINKLLDNNLSMSRQLCYDIYTKFNWTHNIYKIIDIIENIS